MGPREALFVKLLRPLVKEEDEDGQLNKQTEAVLSTVSRVHALHQHSLDGIAIALISSMCYFMDFLSILPQT